jgi:hypothetical protein
LLPLVTFLSQLNEASLFSFNDGFCVQVTETDPRKTVTPVKGSGNAGTRGTMNRIQSRRERKLALQQDVVELRFVGFSCFL